MPWIFGKGIAFWCFQTINHESKYSGPQVISYLMGWGDVYRSHHYMPLYWSLMVCYLLKNIPDLIKKRYAFDMFIQSDFRLN